MKVYLVERTYSTTEDHISESTIPAIATSKADAERYINSVQENGFTEVYSSAQRQFIKPGYFEGDFERVTYYIRERETI